MKLFKNKVGRPSNEIKKKRKIFVVTAIAIIVIFMFGLSVILYKQNDVSKLKGYVINEYEKSYTGRKFFDSYRTKSHLTCEKYGVSSKTVTSGCSHGPGSEGLGIGNSLHLTSKNGGTIALSQYKIPLNLYDYDRIQIYYYVSSDTSNSNIKVGFSINDSIETTKTYNIVAKSGKVVSGLKSITLNLNDSLKKHLNNKKNTDILKLRVYNEDKKPGSKVMMVVTQVKFIRLKRKLPDTSKLKVIGDTISVNSNGITLKSSNSKVLKVVKTHTNKYGVIAVGPGKANINVYKNNKNIGSKKYEITGQVPTIELKEEIPSNYEYSGGSILAKAYKKSNIAITNTPKNYKIVLYSEKTNILSIKESNIPYVFAYDVIPKRGGKVKVIAKLIPEMIGDLKFSELKDSKLIDKFINSSYAEVSQQVNAKIENDEVANQVKQYTNNGKLYKNNIKVEYKNDSGKSETLNIKNGKATYGNVDIYIAQKCLPAQVTKTLPELLELPDKYLRAVSTIIYTEGEPSWVGRTHGTAGIIKMKCIGNIDYRGALSHEIGHAVDGYYSNLTGKLLRNTNKLYENLGDLFNSYNATDKGKNKWPKISPTSSYLSAENNSNGEYFASLFGAYTQSEILRTNKIDNTAYKGYKTNYSAEGIVNGKKVILKDLIHESMKLYDKAIENEYHSQFGVE